MSTDEKGAQQSRETKVRTGTGTFPPKRPSADSQKKGSADRPMPLLSGKSDGRGGDDLAHVAKSAARDTYGAVTAEAAELASNVGHELTHAAERQKQRGADVMVGFAKAITSAADEMAKESPLVAQQFRGAARSVGRLSDDLRDRSVRELIDIASGYARQQPAAFFVGAVAAGFALTRFLKSHETANHGQASGTQGGGTTRSTAAAPSQRM